MKQKIRHALVIIVVSCLIAVIVNSLSANRIPFKGNWPSISGSDSVIVPPSAQPGDPPFISLDEAATLFQSRRVVFIDARDTADYNLGRIRGAINIPYDYYEDFWDAAKPLLLPEKDLVIYCSGEECELSLQLARALTQKGYHNLHVFYGGWREWEKAELPVEGKK